ncbi:MAG: AAA family ATPase [Bacteroidia bacterium]|nr:AAA family ATPase [Bacteroidia bacterium]
MKKLPINRQEFSELINDNCIYVDKTKYIYQLLEHKYYFLSRPRRFGKSLLVNTLKEIFLGNKELFKGLWIYNKIELKKHPVIKISFSDISHKVLGLEKAIHNELNDIAKKYSIKFSKQDYPSKFKELIRKLSEKEKVVVLIDEYDKPIIDYIDDIGKAEENREILKNFYSIVKDSDSYLRFFFVTGVSKFSKVSIFSDLNNLEDITIDENYSLMIGWTEEEIIKYFSEYIKGVEEKYKNIYQDIMKVIKEWYNGYSWDGENFVYNPVSLINLFSKRIFDNYWFETGTPTFLTKFIKEKHYTPFDIEKTTVTTKILDKYELKNMTLLPLLFQSGYLTMKNFELATGIITLDYPNREIADSMSIHILSELTIGKTDKTEMLLFQIADSFNNKEIAEFIEHINTLLASISYTLIDKKEKYFHSLFYIVLKIIGYQIDVEILTIKGRIDAIVKTDTDIFILEFKIDQSADKAIKQIKEKKYAEKYSDDKRPVTLLGINFDTEMKRVDDYKVVKLNV